jgi:hypothetical protein
VIIWWRSVRSLQQSLQILPTRVHRELEDHITQRAGILGQDVDVQLNAGRDELQHAGFILAEACLGLSAVRAKLLGLGHVVLDTDLSQSIVIRLA